MLCLNLFKETFNMRHDFEDDDLILLYERWPNIKFHNIPISWVVPLDEMLGRLRYNNPISEIRQDFGQLCIIHNAQNDKQRMIIAIAEQQIYNIDKDLHEKESNESSIQN